MTFFLGAPDYQWISFTDERPIMVSDNRLGRIKQTTTFPVAYGPWVLDSGAYTIVGKHGRFLKSTEEYVLSVRRYDMNIGGLLWAAPQDFPTEYQVRAKTGGTVMEHVELTVQSFFDCTQEWERTVRHRESPFELVVQGDTVPDYMRCLDLYEHRGVDVANARVIGVGSVCTRERTQEIVDIVTALRGRTKARLHGYGVKAEAIGLFDDVDSQSWSAGARKRRIKYAGCEQFHRVCSSCWAYASAWHDDMIQRHERAKREAGIGRAAEFAPPRLRKFT